MSANIDNQHDEKEKETCLELIQGKVKVGDISWMRNLKDGQSPDELNFGKSGIKGYENKQLDIVIDFGDNSNGLCCIKCDYNKHPVVIMFSDNGTNWMGYEAITATFTDDAFYNFKKPIYNRYGRLLWVKTDGTPIHAQFFVMQHKGLLKGKLTAGDICYYGRHKHGTSFDALDFGKKGLYGYSSKQLDVITDLGKKVNIEGIKCDYLTNPVILMFSDDGKDWSKYPLMSIEFSKDQQKQIFEEHIHVRYGRMFWVKT
eukprot:151795_1